MTPSLTTSLMTAMPRLMSAKRFVAYSGEMQPEICPHWRFCAGMIRENTEMRTLMTGAWKTTNSLPLWWKKQGKTSNEFLIIMLVNQWQCLKSISGVPGLADKKIWRILGGRRRRTRGRWWRSSGDSIWYLHNRHILLNSGKLSLWPQIYTQSVPNSWNELHIRHFWNWQPFENLCPGISWLSSITYSRVTSTLTLDLNVYSAFLLFLIYLHINKY